MPRLHLARHPGPASHRALASLAVLGAASAPATALPPPITLRIVTLNVLGGVGAPGSAGAVAMSKFLTTNDLDGAGPNSGLNPDIVVLEEVTTDADVTAFRDAHLPGFVIRMGTQRDPGGNHQIVLHRPTITFRDLDEYTIGGPRPLVRVTLEVPRADRLLTFYAVHFKCCGDSSSLTQRRTNANESGIAVFNDRALGLDLDDNGSRETPAGYSILLGDLNSNNNLDTTITGVFTHATTAQPTGLRNLPVESLAGRAIGGSPLLTTFPPSSRLDYICLDNALADRFDADASGALDQNELNSIGFVYYSGDDQGRLSNGDTTATTNASDHRPVVFDVLLARAPCPGDASGDGVVNFTDLNIALSQYGQSGAAPGALLADLDADGDVDFADLNIVLSNYGAVC